MLVENEDGTIKIDEQGDLEAGGGAKAGTVVGGMVGLLTGGIGLLAAPLAGAAIGAVGGKVIDRGFSNTFLKSLAERLQPGKSGLLVVVQDDWDVSGRESLAGRSGVILQHELTDRLVAELTGGATPLSEPSGAPRRERTAAHQAPPSALLSRRESGWPRIEPSSRFARRMLTV